MATYSYIVSDQVSGSTGEEFKILIGGVEETYIVGESAFSDIVYAETQFVVDKLSDPTLTATIGVAPAASYGSATDPINNFAGVTLTFLGDTATAINATTFKNEAGAFINAGSNISFSVANVENSGTINLNGSTFKLKPTATVTNDGTINISGGADVNATFSGAGTINLKDNEIEGLTINRGLEADGYNTVKFAGTAAMLLTDTTINAGTVEVNAQNVKLQSGNTIDAANLSFLSTKYIYVEGEHNTINARTSTEGKFVVLRDGGELVDSTVLGAKVKMDDGDYFKNAAQKAVISGTGEYTSIIVRTSSQAAADVVNELTIQNTGATTNDFVFVRKDLYVGLNNQSGKLVLDNANVSVVDPTAVDAVFTVRGPVDPTLYNNLGSTADLTNRSLLTAEQAIIYYGCTVNVELGSMFQANSIGIAAGTTAGGTINIVVDSDDLDADERYTLLDADSINAKIALTVSLDEDDAAPIVDGMKLVTVGDDDYYITTLNHSGVYITSDSQETLYVSADYAELAKGTFIDTGYLVGYNAFGSFTEALVEAARVGSTTISLLDDPEDPASKTGPLDGNIPQLTSPLVINDDGEDYTLTLNLGSNCDFAVTPVAYDDDADTAELIINPDLILDGDRAYLWLNHGRSSGVTEVNGDVTTQGQVSVYGAAALIGDIDAGQTVWISGVAKKIEGDGFETKSVVINGDIDAGAALYVTAGNVFVLSEDIVVGAFIYSKDAADGEGNYLTGLTSIGTDWTISGNMDISAAGNVTFVGGLVWVDGTYTPTTDTPNNIHPTLALGDATIYDANAVVSLIGADMIVAGALTNAGTINVGVGEVYDATANGMVGDGSTITAASLTNSGTINVKASAVLPDDLPAGAGPEAPAEPPASFEAPDTNAAKTVYGASSITLNGNLQNTGTINLTGAVDATDEENPKTYTASLTAKAITNTSTGKFILENASLTGESLYTYGSVVADKSEIKATTNHITNLTTFSVTDSTVTASGSFLNGSSNGHAAKATFDGSTLTATLTNYAGATLNFIDSNYTRTWGTITNNGTFSVFGGSTITAKDIVTSDGTFTIGGDAQSEATTLTLSGSLDGTIQLLDGAKISASSIAAGGTLNIGMHQVVENEVPTPVGNNVAFSGANSFATTEITNAGTITVDAGASISAKSIEGGTLNLVANTTAIGAETATLVVTADLSASHDTAIQVNGVAAFANAAERDAFYAADQAFVAVTGTSAGSFTLLKDGNQYSLIQTPNQETLYVGTAEDLAGHPNYVLNFNAFTSFKDALLKAVEVGSATVTVISDGYTDASAGYDVALTKSLTINGKSVTITGEGEICIWDAPEAQLTYNSNIATADNIVVSWQPGGVTYPVLRPKTQATINADISAGKMIQFGSDATVSETATLNHAVLPLTADLGVALSGRNVQFSGPYNGMTLENATASAFSVSITGTGTYDATKTYEDAQVLAESLTFVDGSIGATNSKVYATGRLLFTDDGVARQIPLTASLVSNNTTWNVNELKVAYYAGSDTAEATREVTLAEGAGVFTFTNSVLNITGALDNVARKRIGGSSISDAAIAGAPALTINLDASTVSAATINNAGTIEATGASTINGAITNSGTFTVTGTDGTKNATINGSLANNTGTITWDDVTANGAISDWTNQKIMNVKDSDVTAYSLTNSPIWEAVVNAENSTFNLKRLTNAGRFNLDNGKIIAANLLDVGYANSKLLINQSTEAGFVADKTKTAISTASLKNVGTIQAKAATIDATEFTNSGTFEGSNVDITTNSIANSGTFEGANVEISGTSAALTNTGKFTLDNSSLVGFATVAAGDATADNYFNAKGALTLQIVALTGVISVVDDATFTKTSVTGGKFVIADGETATFNAVGDISNAVSAIEGGAIVVYDSAMTAGAITGSAITVNAGAKLTAGAIDTTGTITVAGQLSATSITSTTGSAAITITAAGAAAATDPIALTVTAEAGISKSEINLSFTVPETTTAYQYVLGKIGNDVTFKVTVGETTYTVADNDDIGETGYILSTKGNTGVWIVKKAPTDEISVSSTYTPTSTEGYGIDKFDSLISALKGIQTDTYSFVVETEYAPAETELLTADIVKTFGANSETNKATISGKNIVLGTKDDTTTEAVEHYNVILKAKSGKTLQIDNNIALTGSSIVLNHNGGDAAYTGTAIVNGNLSGYEVQIDGNATVAGTLTAETLLWLRNGRSNTSSTIDKIALTGAVSGKTVLLSSGNITTTAAVSGKSLVVGKLDDGSGVAANIESTGSAWTFSSNMLAYGDAADVLTLNGGSIAFAGVDGSEILIPGVDVPKDTVQIENANFTLNLNGAAMNAVKISNAGTINLDKLEEAVATLTASDAITNAATGKIYVKNGSQLSFAKDSSNAGVIEVTGGSKISSAAWFINSKTLTVTGSEISAKLSNSGANASLTATDATLKVDLLTQSGATTSATNTTIDVDRLWSKGGSTVTLTNSPSIKATDVTVDATSTLTLVGGEFTSENLVIGTLTGNVTLNGVAFNNVSVAGGSFEVAGTDATSFAGINTVSGLTVDAGATLALSAAATLADLTKASLVVNGNLVNNGTITIDATGLDWGSTLKTIKVIDVAVGDDNIVSTGTITVTGTDKATAVIKEDGIYLFKTTGDIPTTTLFVNNSWTMDPGTEFPYDGVNCVMGVNAFKATDDIVYAANTTALVVAASATPYGDITWEKNNTTLTIEGEGTPSATFGALTLGDATLTGNITAGDTTLGAVTVNGNLTTDALTVGDAIFNGNVLANGNVALNGDTVLKGTLGTTATGNVTLADGKTISMKWDNPVNVTGTLTAGADSITIDVSKGLQNVLSDTTVISAANDVVYSSVVANFDADIMIDDGGTLKLSAAAIGKVSNTLSGIGVYGTIGAAVASDATKFIMIVDGDYSAENVYLQGKRTQVLETAGKVAKNTFAGGVDVSTLAYADNDFIDNFKNVGKKTAREAATNVTIDAGQFNGYVLGADMVKINKTTESDVTFYRYSDVNLTINGGSFATTVGGVRAIAGGLMYAISKADGKGYNSSAKIFGNVNLTISGGSFYGYNIYGGNYANNDKFYGAYTSITGNTKITLDASKNTLTFGKNNQSTGIIQGGSYGPSFINGNTEIVLTGDKGIVFQQLIGGSASDEHLWDDAKQIYTCNSYVTGNRTLTFTAFKGDLDFTKIQDFNIVSFEGANEVNFAEGTEGSFHKYFNDDVTTWKFDASAAITGNFEFDFAGDTVDLSAFTAASVGEGWELNNVTSMTGATVNLSGALAYNYDAELQKLTVTANLA